MSVETEARNAPSARLGMKLIQACHTGTAAEVASLLEAGAHWPGADARGRPSGNCVHADRGRG